MSDYWADFARQRQLSRRRALGLTAGGLAGALFVACGGSPSGPASSESGASSAASSSAPSAAKDLSLKTNEPEFTPSNGPIQKGGTFHDHFSTAAGWNPVSSETEGRHTGGRYSW